MRHNGLGAGPLRHVCKAQECSRLFTEVKGSYSLPPPLRVALVLGGRPGLEQVESAVRRVSMAVTYRNSAWAATDLCGRG